MSTVRTDLGIDEVEQPSGLVLTTRGLAALGRPELQLPRVPAVLAADARALLAALARIAAQRRLAPGALVAVPFRGSVAFVRLVHADGALRLTAPERDALPSSAIASAILDRALGLLARGDRENAVAHVRRSIALVPGDPACASALRLGPHANTENARSHLALAFLEPGAGAASFLDALERNLDLFVYEVGAYPEDLEKPSYTRIAELARFIAYTTLREDPVVPEADGAEACLRSPIWYLGRGGTVARASSRRSLAFRELYWGTAPARVLEESFTIDAIVDAFAKQRARPLALVERTFPTNVLWRHPDEESPPSPTPRPFVPPSRLLSLMLAHVAHGVAAGLDRDEIRASLGAIDDASLRARADRKLDAFAARVARWQEESRPS